MLHCAVLVASRRVVGHVGLIHFSGWLMTMDDGEGFCVANTVGSTRCCKPLVDPTC
jgi:hypothetical protein